MGREIRKVKKDWKHNEKDAGGGCQPKFDTSLEEAQAEWDEEKRRFDAIGPNIKTYGMEPENPVEFEGKSYSTYPDSEEKSYAEWNGERPDDPAYYRPKWSDEERTHFQVYETVTEGTPVTPSFPSLDQLEDYLVNVGADWDGPVSREIAKAFCKMGHVPSMAIVNGKVLNSFECAKLATE